MVETNTSVRRLMFVFLLLFHSIFGSHALKGVNSDLQVDQRALAATQLTPKNCSAGTEYNATAHFCQNCTAGEYSVEGGNCTACAAGKFSIEVAASNCTRCLVGTFSPSAGAFSCEVCNSGQYQASIGQTDCDPCPAGSYCPNSGMSSPIDCPAGTASGEPGNSGSCQTCDAGSYAPSGSLFCNTCLAGTYSSSGASNCTSCSVGRYQPEAVGSSCYTCNAGTYAPSRGSSSCTDCPAGSYCAGVAASTYETCDVNTYSTGGASSCSHCWDNSYSDEGASTCIACESEVSLLHTLEVSHLAQINSTSYKLWFNASLCVLGDVNGDGVDDLAIGSPTYGVHNTGAVFILFMNSTGYVNSVQEISMNEGNLSSHFASTTDDASGILVDGTSFGASVTAVGDVNGDSKLDIAVGATGGSGKVYVLSLGTDGKVLGVLTVVSNFQLGEFFQISTYDGCMFGASITSLGDIEGDGGVDLAVGAPFLSSGTDFATGTVILLSISSTGSLIDASSVSTSEFSNFGFDLLQLDRFGTSVVNMNDRAGNINATFAAGAPGRDEVYLITVDLKFSPSGSYFEVASMKKVGERELLKFGYDSANATEFGSALAFGDVDNDGVSDLLISSNYNSSIYVFNYDSSHELDSIQQVRGFEGSNATSFGAAIVVLDDYDGDSYIEIMTTATFTVETTKLFVFNVEGYSCPTFAPTMVPTSPTMVPTASPTVFNVLKELYTSTSGSQWTSKARWLQGDPCMNEWDNIDCDESNNVVELYFRGNNLVGTIPTEIGLLTDLSGLFFNLEPFISGSLPSEIGSLTSMTQMGLYNTSLGGPIPSQVGRLTQMDYFILLFNDFSGSIPSEIGQWYYPDIVVHTGSMLSGSLPSQLGLLTTLRTIGVLNTEVSGTIPSELGQLTLLKEFILPNNKLTGSIPSELGGLIYTNGGVTPSAMPTSSPTTFNYDGGNRGGDDHYGYDDTYETSYFILVDNYLCGDVPAEVQALEDSSVAGEDFTFANGATYSSFDIDTGNALGTDCCIAIPDTYNCGPTPSPTSCGDRHSDICNLLTASCTDDVTNLCESEFCTTCAFAHSCDYTCGICSEIEIPSPTPSPTMVPTYAPSSLPSPLPTPVPTYKPSMLPTLPPSFLPTPSPTNYPRPNCTNGTSMKLTLYEEDALGWEGKNILVENNAGTNILVNRSLDVGRYLDADWLCFEVDCYKISVPTISTTVSWDLVIQEDDGSSQLAVIGSDNAAQNFCVDENGIRSSPTLFPTLSPTPLPSYVPTDIPSASPTMTHVPSTIPTSSPSPHPSPLPTLSPSSLPTYQPTFSPTWSPTLPPTSLPTMSPTEQCGPGQYLNSETHACVSCIAGTYRNATMVGNLAAKNYPFSFTDACESCTAGYYSASGAAECTKCDAGKVSNDNFDACQTCVAGTYPNNLTQTCTDCPLGKYTPFPMDACLSCAAGFATGVASGGSLCTACNPGEYSNGTSKTCTNCPSGTYSFSRASECETCEAGKYDNGVEKSFCRTCVDNYGVGYTSPAGASGCYICSTGYYWGYLPKKKQNNANNLTGCVSCPDFADCAGGSSEGEIYQPQPKDGYWIDREAAANNPSLIAEVYACPRPSTCVKIKINESSTTSARRLATATSSSCTLLANYDHPDCPADISCEEGSTGALCGTCKSGRKFSTATQKCESCASNTTWLSAFLFICTIVLLFTILYMVRSGELYIPDFIQPMFGGVEKVHIPLLGVLYHMESGTLKVLWVTAQIIQSINFNLSVQFPAPYSSIVYYFSFFELDFLSLECYRSGYILGVYLASAFPILLAVVCWLLFFVRKTYLVVAGSVVTMNPHKKLFAEHMRAFLLIIYIFVPPVSNKQFRALDCQTLSDGQSYLRADTSVDCNSSSYENFLFYNGILIFIYQCFPLLYVALLWRVKDKLNPKAANKELALELRDSDESLESIRFLFSDYKCSRWYFEILDLYRRIFFVGVLPLMGSNGVVKTYIGCALALLSTIYFRELTPFRVEFTNFLAYIAQYVILLAFMAALLIQSDSVDSFGINNFALGSILFAANVILMGLALFLGWRRYRRERALAKSKEASMLKIEWAVEFSSNKFDTTLRNVIQRAVPASHCLCYYYTSLKQAQLSVRVGEIPATQSGIVVSLMGPMNVLPNDPSLRHMHPLAPSREAVICLSIPHALLFPLENGTGNISTKHLRIIPSDVLVAMGRYVPPKKKNRKRAMTAMPKEGLDGKEGGDTVRGREESTEQAMEFRGSNLQEEANSSTMPSNALTLIMKSALRAYQLKANFECTSPRISASEFFHPIMPEYNPGTVFQPTTCLEYTEIMRRVREECAAEGTVPLYHYTIMGVADMILEGGFRMSTQGQGDGGMYFSTLGPSSYELGSEDYETNIIVDCFGKERLEEYRGKHKLDVVFIYGINPKCVEQAPGGRENAKMISKVLFEGFSPQRSDGNYYLRPDFIKAALLIDGTTPLPRERDLAKEALDYEKEQDRAVQHQLKSMEKKLKHNTALVKLAQRYMFNIKSSSLTSDDEAGADEPISDFTFNASPSSRSPKVGFRQRVSRFAGSSSSGDDGNIHTSPRGEVELARTVNKLMPSPIDEETGTLPHFNAPDVSLDAEDYNETSDL